MVGYDTIMLNQLVALSRIHRYKGKGAKGTLVTNRKSTREVHEIDMGIVLVDTES